MKQTRRQHYPAADIGNTQAPPPIAAFVGRAADISKGIRALTTDILQHAESNNYLPGDLTQLDNAIGSISRRLDLLECACKDLLPILGK